MEFGRKHWPYVLLVCVSFRIAYASGVVEQGAYGHKVSVTHVVSVRKSGKTDTSSTLYGSVG